MHLQRPGTRGAGSVNRTQSDVHLGQEVVNHGWTRMNPDNVVLQHAQLRQSAECGRPRPQQRPVLQECWNRINAIGGRVSLRPGTGALRWVALHQRGSPTSWKSLGTIREVSSPAGRAGGLV